MALSRQSASALKTWRAGETQFFAGQRPLTDLISFATDYYSSLASYEEQRVQYIATQWQIVGALGKLTDLTEKVQSLPAPAITQINAAEHNSVAPATFTSRANNAVSPADELAPEAFVTTSASH
jgi:hypothetical protein